MSDYLQEKETLIQEITTLLMGWDRSLEQGKEILAENDRLFLELRLLDKKIPENDLKKFNENNNEQWMRILKVQEELIQVVQSNMKEVRENLSQINKKEKVVSNYMSIKNKSIFIEKDY